jgi:hypothetical protein
MKFLQSLPQVLCSDPPMWCSSRRKTCNNNLVTAGCAPPTTSLQGGVGLAQALSYYTSVQDETLQPPPTTTTTRSRSRRSHIHQQVGFINNMNHLAGGQPGVSSTPSSCSHHPSRSLSTTASERHGTTPPGRRRKGFYPSVDPRN